MNKGPRQRETSKVRFQPAARSTKIIAASTAGDGYYLERDEQAMSGDHLDLSSDAPRRLRSNSSASDGRRFVGVHFACCDVYTRVYINRDQTAYDGRCPKCAKHVVLRIGPGGTDARFFSAG
jgi:hypothetical protein